MAEVQWDKDLEPKIRELLKSASEARNLAYCPYSGFRVGAALLCDENQTIYTGCNVENASYGISICAERVAMVKAVSDGHRFFKAIAVACDMRDFVGPCGACRQFIIEFGKEWDLYLVKPDMSWKKIRIGELLPLHFGPECLQEHREGNLANQSSS